MRFKKFKHSAIYTAIFLQLAVSTVGVTGVAHARSTQYQDMAVESTVLQPGESVADIARKNNLMVDHLWEINSFEWSDKAAFLAAGAGQTIWIPAAPAVKASTLPLAHATVQAPKTNKADVKANDKTTDARQFGQDQLNSLASKQAEAWLNGFGGSSRVAISSAKNFAKYNYAGDVLLPLWNSREDFMIFSQLGVRHADDRTTGNVGVGARYFADGWMLGNNVFFDNDFSGNNRRIGIGAEVGTDAMRLNANGYFKLNGWHDSRFIADHDERPANGWDIELSSWLPVYPQLGAKVKYEQYYGDNVALISRDRLQHNPSVATVGVNWTPVPLVTIDAGHRMSMQRGEDTTIGLNLNWNFGRSLDWHLSPEAVAAQRSLAGSRYDLVSRNNQIVMDYREQTVITFSLASAIQGVEGTQHSLGVSVWAKHGLDKIVWDDAALVAAGGKVVGTGANSALVLPTYKEGADNHYTLSAIAYDNKGKASPRAQVQITVEKAEQTQPEQPAQPAQPDALRSTLKLGADELIANGTDQTHAVIDLKDKNGNPVSNETDNLRLEATLLDTKMRASSRVTIGQFRELGKVQGNYVVDLTAGHEDGIVTLTLYHGNQQLGQPQTLKLKAKEAEVVKVTNLAFVSKENKFVAGSNATFTVKATDINGKPVKDAIITFTDQNGKTIAAANDGKTDAQGNVSATLVEKKAGNYSVTVRVAGEKKPVAMKRFTVIADVNSAQIWKSQTTDGKIKAGSVQMSKPAGFTITLRDRFENPIIGEKVSVLAVEDTAGKLVNIQLLNQNKTDIKGNVSGSAAIATPHYKTTTYTLKVMINGKRVDGPKPKIMFVRC
ncbi:hypothetical protein CTZ24_14825 [Pantoea phytobeneficialis]|uniref:Big-1 domain-containing protein n=2 Tax=Pantoea phytobeneficialis TaxID=2052056 RepID=A0AAP9KQ45_9GAMM|nr:hypothetical protein CTZ24_14825 [Pantoea phytobeneficialis]